MGEIFGFAEISYTADDDEAASDRQDLRYPEAAAQVFFRKMHASFVPRQWIKEMFKEARTSDWGLITFKIEVRGP